MSTEILGRAASGAEARTLRIELIKTLYTQQPTVLIASILNAAIVTFVVWDVVPRPWPALWLALICAVALAQVALWRYRRQPEFEDSASLLVAAALAHGIVWGAAGVMFFTPGIVIYQVFLAFVIGGMCAGAAAALSTYMPAFLRVSRSQHRATDRPASDRGRNGTVSPWASCSRCSVAPCWCSRATSTARLPGR